MGIASLDTATPTSSTLASTGAADIRALRVAIRETFVNFGIGTDVVTATAAQINGAPNKAGAETISGAWNFTSGTTMNGISNGAGTAAVPAYSFSSDTNTGMYSSGDDEVGVSVGGARVGKFSGRGLELFNTTAWTGVGFWYGANRKFLIDVDNADGDFGMYPVLGTGDGTGYGPAAFIYRALSQVVDVEYPLRITGGTPALPALRFAADGDTGIYQNGSVKLGFTVDGVSRGYFDAAGTFNLTGDFGVGGTSYFSGLTGASNPVTNNNTTIPNTSDVLFEVNKRTAVMSLQNNSEAVAVGTAEIANWTNKTVPASSFLTDDISGGRITVASGYTGYYRVTAQGTIRSTVGSITATIEVRKNGSALSHPAQTKITLPVNQYGSFSLDCCVYCTAADYLSLFSTVTTSAGTIDNLHFTVSRAV